MSLYILTNVTDINCWSYIVPDYFIKWRSALIVLHIHIYEYSIRFIMWFNNAWAMCFYRIYNCVFSKIGIFSFLWFLFDFSTLRKKRPRLAQGRYMGTELQTNRFPTTLDCNLKKTKMYCIILITNLDTFPMSFYLPFSLLFPSCRSVMIANRRIGRQNGQTREGFCDTKPALGVGE